MTASTDYQLDHIFSATPAFVLVRVLILSLLGFPCSGLSQHTVSF